MAPSMAGRPGPVNDTSKILAALGYPIWIVALIAILIEPYKNEKFVKSHAVQAIALGLAEWVVLFVLGMIPFVNLITPLVGLALFIYQIILALKAWNGEYVEIPVIYGYVKSYIGD
jgi:uncharacterized membrane protein